ncbi:MAG TPA: NAD(+) diphosphatase, partial [Geobacteraceae bacterium]|nr:NAD(+) diphosphatase [Geobacteraceae bacterium]
GIWVILQGTALVIRREGEICSLPEGEPADWLDPGNAPLCIGLWQGKPVRALAIGKGVVPPAPFMVEPFNAVEERLDDRLLTLGGLAHQIFHWEKQSAVCSRCGGEMTRIPGSWGKKCLSCRHEHYPHIHPCVIVLVKRGDEFLLIRKAEWPAGRYSLIAGFVDIGESLEECVHREVGEEAGVRVKNLRYVGSQNWPFPSQLMAGFVADYDGGEVRADHTEIEDAQWFCAGRMPASLPLRRSIARYIIDTWALKGEG